MLWLGECEPLSMVAASPPMQGTLWDKLGVIGHPTWCAHSMYELYVLVDHTPFADVMQCWPLYGTNGAYCPSANASASCNVQCDTGYNYTGTQPVCNYGNWSTSTIACTRGILHCTCYSIWMEEILVREIRCHMVCAGVGRKYQHVTHRSICGDAG